VRAFQSVEILPEDIAIWIRIITQSRVYEMKSGLLQGRPFVISFSFESVSQFSPTSPVPLALIALAILFASAKNPSPDL
jgi:hypothetical protein